MLMESYNMWSCMTGFFSFSIMFSIFIYNVILLYSIPFYGQIIFHDVDILLLFIHLSVDGHLAVINDAAMNICRQGFI